jgi:TRAP-type C4-dicarboxylate transport system substrate-binding protein
LKHVKLLAAGAIAGAAFAAAMAPATPAQAKEFINAPWPPAMSHVNRVTWPKVIKEISKATNGKVKWRLVPGGSLANPKESFQATSNGLIQGALGISTYVPNLVPSLNTIYSTIVFDQDVTTASGAAMETFYLNCPTCLEEFKKINIAPLSGWTSSQYYLACRSPYPSVASLKGKRLRATGGYSELWRMAGAVPVAATLPEAVTLLQRGGLDCQNGVHTWLKIFGYGDFAKNITNFPVGLTGPAIGWMINRDAWKTLTRSEKLIHMKQAAWVTSMQALSDFTNDNNKSLKFVMEKKKVKLIKADAAGFKALFAKYDGEQRVRNIANAKKFGVANPGAIIDAYKKNLVKWAKLTKDIPRTLAGVDAFTDLVWTHIYSKVDPDTL